MGFFYETGLMLNSVVPDQVWFNAPSVKVEYFCYCPAASQAPTPIALLRCPVAIRDSGFTIDSLLQKGVSKSKTKESGDKDRV